MLVQLTNAVARTLWLCAYADGIDNDEISGPAPGGGEDWDDFAPTTPPEAEAKARALLACIGHARVRALAARWTADTSCSLDRFGHCVALQALGHGVGLQDDYPAGKHAPRIQLPNIEFGAYDVDVTHYTDVFQVEREEEA